MASAGASGHSTVTPSCNRLLQKKWDDKKIREHKDRLRTMKSSIDTGSPKNFTHIKQNLRKKQIEEDRTNLIQRHNNELLHRMHHIMSTTGRVDHRNTDWRPKKSLNYMKRAQEMQQVNRENQAILHRIQSVQPQYKVHSMEVDYVTHKRRMHSLSLFPPIIKPCKKPTLTGSDASTKEREGVVLPPIVEPSRPDTHGSEVKEDIEVAAEEGVD